MTKHVLLNPDGSVAGQVIDYVPAHDNPDGLFEAVSVKQFAKCQHTQDFDKKSRSWKTCPLKHEKHQQFLRSRDMTRPELIATIDDLAGRLTRLEQRG